MWSDDVDDIQDDLIRAGHKSLFIVCLILYLLGFPVLCVCYAFFGINLIWRDDDDPSDTVDDILDNAEFMDSLNISDVELSDYFGAEVDFEQLEFLFGLDLRESNLGDDLFTYDELEKKENKVFNLEINKNKLSFLENIKESKVLNESLNFALNGSKDKIKIRFFDNNLYTKCLKNLDIIKNNKLTTEKLQVFNLLDLKPTDSRVYLVIPEKELKYLVKSIGYYETNILIKEQEAFNQFLIEAAISQGIFKHDDYVFDHYVRKELPELRYLMKDLTFEYFYIYKNFSYLYEVSTLNLLKQKELRVEALQEYLLDSKTDYEKFDSLFNKEFTELEFNQMISLNNDFTEFLVTELDKDKAKDEIKENIVKDIYHGEADIKEEDIKEEDIKEEENILKEYFQGKGRDFDDTLNKFSEEHAKILKSKISQGISNSESYKFIIKDSDIIDEINKYRTEDILKEGVSEEGREATSRLRPKIAVKEQDLEIEKFASAGSEFASIFNQANDIIEEEISEEDIFTDKKLKKTTKRNIDENLFFGLEAELLGIQYDYVQLLTQQKDAEVLRNSAENFVQAYLNYMIDNINEHLVIIKDNSRFAKFTLPKIALNLSAMDRLILMDKIYDFIEYKPTKIHKIKVYKKKTIINNIINYNIDKHKDIKYREMDIRINIREYNIIIENYDSFVESVEELVFKGLPSEGRYINFVKNSDSFFDKELLEESNLDFKKYWSKL